MLAGLINQLTTPRVVHCLLLTLTRRLVNGVCFGRDTQTDGCQPTPPAASLSLISQIQQNEVPRLSRANERIIYPP